VTQLLFSGSRVSRRKHSFNVRPNEHGRDALVLLAEFRKQQRSPELLESGVTGRAPQERFNSDLLEPPPIVDTRAVKDRCGQPKFAPQTQRRKAQEIDVIAQRIKFGIDVVTSLRRTPSNAIAQSDAIEES
jgi:hypothetical protein